MYEPKAIGIVFDLSLRHLDGRRILDIVKGQVKLWLRAVLEETEDYFYFYHPQIIEPTTHRGEALAAISNYVTEGWFENLRDALLQTLFVIAAQDARRYLVLFTDRIQDHVAIERAIALNEKERANCEFILVGLGPYYRKEILEKQILRPNVSFICSEEGNDLLDQLLIKTR